MTAPSWFLKELAIIDPDYFMTWNNEYEYWELRKDMEINRTDKDNGLRIRIKDPVLGVFKILNDDALLSLRKRKYIGLKYSHNPLAYLKDIQARNREAKAKGRHFAQEMQAEGILKMHRLATTKTFT